MVRARAWARETGRSTGSAVALGLVGVVLVAGLVPAVMAPVGASDRPGQPSTDRPTRLVVQPHQASERIRHRPAGLSDDPARGMVYRGLARSERCPGGFMLVGAADRTGCTTGPEPLHEPEGSGSGREHTDDVSRERSTAELYDAAGTTETAAEAAATGAVPCYGDGVSGSRVQAVYAVAADRVDRYDSVAPLIQSSYAPRADAVFVNSAAVGGEVRHVRWVTTPGCQLDVIHAVLSPTGDDSLSNTRTELRNLGLTRTDRKYLVWTDASIYCGIGNIVGDSQPGVANAANRGPTFGRVDTGCWGYASSVEAHELAHTLGAVQLDAPNSNGSWHCTDEYDRMCYLDASGTPVSYVCPSASEALFDCDGDDYFSVDPLPGSWLESHWNVANSVFLARSEPEPTPSATATPTPSASPTPEATPTPSTTSSATASPTPSPTDSPTTSVSPTPSPTPSKGDKGGGRGKQMVSGELTRADPREVFRVRTKAGRVVAEVSFRRADKLHLKVLRLDGRVMAHRFGDSSLRVAEGLRANTYRIVVRGEPTRFRLTVRYPR